MRLPAALLDVVKARASRIPDTRSVRLLLETDVTRPKEGPSCASRRGGRVLSGGFAAERDELVKHTTQKPLG
jgi:hypothetical protein